ncbi:MAG TPA: hypothetical protein VGM03_01160 [Phycisphaerae bacterium]|jgi:hypothetical protein
MKYALSIGLVAALASACVAGEQNMRFLTDRLAESDVVVVAVAGPSMVVEIANPPDDRRYLAVATLTITDVIKGNAAVGVPLEVSLSLRATATRSMVENPDPPDPDPAVWFLRQTPSYYPVSLGTLALTRTGSPQDFPAYVAQFHSAEQAMEPYAAIQMSLMLPTTISLGATVVGMVQLSNPSSNPATLPSSFPWSGHVQIALERDDDGYMSMESGSTSGDEPDLAVESIAGVSGDTIPASFPPGFSVQANLTAVTCEVHLDGPSGVFFAYARLVDDQSKTLIQAAPVTITVSAP